MNAHQVPRWINAVLGIWLFLSTFLWEHSSAQLANAWIVGFATAFTAIAAMRADRLRYMNAALAAWLFLSAWILPLASNATFGNSLVVAVVMFISALVPQTPVPRAQQRPARPPMGAR